MIKLSGLRVAGKLYLMIALAAAGIVVIASVGHHLLGQALEKGQHGLVRTLPAFNALNDARAALLRLRVLALYHVLNTDEKAMADLDRQIVAHRASIDTALGTYADKRDSDEEERRMLGALSASVAQYYRGLDEALAMSRGSVGAVPAQARAVLEGMAPVIETMDASFDQMMERYEKLRMKSVQEAIADRSHALWVTILLTGLILSLLGLLGWAIASRELARPIGAVVDNLKQLAAGGLHVTIAGEERRDEVGDIARAAKVFKEFVLKLDDQNWIRTHAGDVAAALHQAEDLRALAGSALSGIAPVMGAGHGSLYVAEGENRYRLLARYAHRELEHPESSVALGEGLVGQCARDKAPILLDVPGDYVRIGSALGEGPAACVLVQPIVHGERVLGVLELASFRHFTDREKAFLEALQPVLAASMAILERNVKTRELLASTREQAERLEKQAAELHAQRAELIETEEWFRSIVGMSPDGMMVVDVSGRILLANAASEQLFGYEPGELVGGQIEQLVPARVRSRHPALRESFLEENRSRSMSDSPTLTGLRKDGSEIRMAIVLSPLPSSGSRGRCVSLAVRPVAQA